MSFADTEMCEIIGVDPKKVESIARRLSRAAKEADAIGLEVFGWSGTGCLFSKDIQIPCGHETYFVEVAILDGTFDGGDPNTATHDEVRDYLKKDSA